MKTEKRKTKLDTEEVTEAIKKVSDRIWNLKFHTTTLHKFIQNVEKSYTQIYKISARSHNNRKRLAERLKTVQITLKSIEEAVVELAYTVRLRDKTRSVTKNKSPELEWCWDREFDRAIRKLKRMAQTKSISSRQQIV
jgi:DNA repair ATPase RecN